MSVEDTAVSVRAVDVFMVSIVVSTGLVYVRVKDSAI